MLPPVSKEFKAEIASCGIENIAAQFPGVGPVHVFPRLLWPDWEAATIKWAHLGQQ